MTGFQVLWDGVQPLLAKLEEKSQADFWAAASVLRCSCGIMHGRKRRSQRAPCTRTGKVR